MAENKAPASGQNVLAEMIRNMNKGKRYPALNVVNKDPTTAAVISKLMKPREKSEFDISRKETYYQMNQNEIKSISDSIMRRKSDNESIIQLFPDIELCIQILVSCILSPKDMTSCELNYRVLDSTLPSALQMKLLDVVREHFENHYGFTEELYTIVREVLFDSGSHIRAVLPESSVDEIINSNPYSTVSTESIRSTYVGMNGKIPGLGYLGSDSKSANTLSFESVFGNRSLTSIESEELTLSNENSEEKYNLFIEVTDNFEMLKFPKVLEAITKKRSTEIINSRRSVSFENYRISGDKLNNRELSGVLFKGGDKANDPFVKVNTREMTKRKSIGRPLELTLPSESVIPIYIPGDHRKQIGAFVVIDEDGNPITGETEFRGGDDLQAMLQAGGSNQTQSLSSLLITKAKRNLIQASEAPTLDNIVQVYSSIIEDNLIRRLNNGLYNNKVNITAPEEIYKVMLFRALKSKMTRILFIPAELFTYFAVKFHRNGVGKSLLDDLKILTGLRAIMLFAKVMAQAKSSINVTTVAMELDPRDPDPQKTIEIAKHEISKIRQQYFPLGINSAQDLVDWIQRAGFEFTFEGHPGLPSTKFNFDTKNLDHTIPDSDLDEDLRKQTYMALGLNPETVDSGAEAEFATTIVQNNILLAKRVAQYQKQFSPLISDWLQKLIYNDAIAFNELLAIFKEQSGDVEKSLTDEEKEVYATDKDQFLKELCVDFLNRIWVEFPQPDGITIENLKEEYETYKSALEDALDQWISSDILPSEVAGEANGVADSIKKSIAGHYLRKWMADNNYLTELADIASVDEEGNPSIDLYEVNAEHTKAVMRSLVKFIHALKDDRKAVETDLEAMNTEGSGDSYSGSDDDSDSSGNYSDSGDEFEMDMSSFDNEDGESEDEESEETEEEEEEAPEEEPKEAEEPPEE